MIINYNKQLELIDSLSFKKPINVIGCGAIGSWVTMMLLKMGFKDIKVYDFDEVEEHNIPNQYFKERHIGKTKVDAMLETYYEDFNEENYEPRIEVVNKRLTRLDALKLNGIVFCCVDSMKSRKNLFGGFELSDAELWIEGRLSIYGGYVYTMTKDDYSTEEYKNTFYSDEEAEVSACGISQTALPAAINISSVMIMQMIAWYNELNDKKKSYYKEIKYSIPWFDIDNSNFG